MSEHLPTRQAVVVIHGIGEERPMETLRTFVSTVVCVTNATEQKFWSKPDDISQSFELRKFIAPGDGIDWPMTDYFEYYWASNMRDTKMSHVLRWLAGLLFRPYRAMPRRIRWIWLTTWILIAAAIAFALLSLTGLVGVPTMPVLPAWVMSLASLLGAAVVNGVFIAYIGDAARYLSPEPTNIAQRQAIRKDGVELIQRLHACGKYGRIIVVGHSLGSVIAYDILRFAWDAHRQDHVDVETPERVSAMKAICDLTERRPASGELRDYWNEYQEAQKRLWRAERMRGGSWLVTDLVTCGSPLAHAAVLLAKDISDLRHWQWLRELPTCPPVRQATENPLTYDIPVVDDHGHETGTANVLHTSALFAMTRWTNLYFSADFIGGPLHEVFGRGIRDIQITEDDEGAKVWRPEGSFWKGRTWLSHTMYWTDPNGGRNNKHGELLRRWNAVRRMRGAMRVNDMAMVTFPDTTDAEPGDEYER